MTDNHLNGTPAGRPDPTYYELARLLSDHDENRFLPTQSYPIGRAEDSPEDIEQWIREGIQPRQLKSIDQIAEEIGCSVEEIPQRFTQMIETLERQVSRKDGYSGLESEVFIDPLFQIWNATRDLPEGHPLTVFSRSLESFDIFFDTYFPEGTARLKYDIIKYIDLFCDFVVAQWSIRSVATGEPTIYTEFPQRYDNVRRWVALPRESPYRSITVTTPKIIEEALNLRKNPCLEELLIHATASAALEGIEREKALLSAQAVIETGHQLRTGEYLSYIAPYQEPGETGGLDNIYGSWNKDQGYSRIRWFNEYQIMFGINSDRLRVRLQRECGEKPLLHDRAGDGVPLGKRVPLGEVDYIFVPADRLEQMREWTSQNAPHITVISIEAWKLLDRFSRRDLIAASQQNPIEVKDNESRCKNHAIESCKTEGQKEVDRLVEELGEGLPTRSELEKYRPHRNWFLRPEASRGIHGISHEARVLILQELIARLLIRSNQEEVNQEALRWVAVTHDTQRVHDEYDLHHGETSSTWVKEQAFIPDEVRPTVRYLNHWHALPDSQAPMVSTDLKVFKDADGLDRARLGDLDVRYLRLEQSKKLILVAEELYRRSNHLMWENHDMDQFDAVLETAVDMGIVRD